MARTWGSGRKLPKSSSVDGGGYLHENPAAPDGVEWAAVEPGGDFPAPSGSASAGKVPVATGTGNATVWGAQSPNYESILVDDPEGSGTTLGGVAVNVVTPNDITLESTVGGSVRLNVNGQEAIQVASDGMAGTITSMRGQTDFTEEPTVGGDPLPYLPLPSGTASAGKVPIATGTGNASAWGTPSGGANAPEFGVITNFESITDRYTAVTTGTGSASVDQNGLALGGAGIIDDSGIIIVDGMIANLLGPGVEYSAFALLYMTGYDTGDNSTAIFGIGPSIIDDLTGNVAVFEFVQTDQDVVVNTVTSDGVVLHRTSNVATYSGGFNPHRFRITNHPGTVTSILFYIDGVLVATHTTRLPSSSSSGLVSTIKNDSVVNGPTVYLVSAGIVVPS